MLGGVKSINSTFKENMLHWRVQVYHQIYWFGRCYMLIDSIWKWFILNLNEQISRLMDNDVESPGFCPSTVRSFP